MNAVVINAATAVATGIRQAGAQFAKQPVNSFLAAYATVYVGAMIANDAYRIGRFLALKAKPTAKTIGVTVKRGVHNVLQKGAQATA